jgi:hypothetical protein
MCRYISVFCFEETVHSCQSDRVIFYCEEFIRKWWICGICWELETSRIDCGIVTSIQWTVQFPGSLQFASYPWLSRSPETGNDCPSDGQQQFNRPTARWRLVWEQLVLLCASHSFMCLWSWYDHLCGLVVRVLGYRSGGPGSIPGTTKKKE